MQPTGALQPRIIALALGALTEKAFTPRRVKGVLQKLEDGRRNTNAEGQTEYAALTKELRDNELATKRLYEVIEPGVIKVEDSILQQRFHEHLAPHRVRRRTHSLKRDIDPAALSRRADSPMSMTLPRTTLTRGQCAPLPHRSSASPHSTLPQHVTGVSSARFAAAVRLFR